jgi:TetR/AcrR family transcriptional regulator, transcriptional repressor for nem operon
MARPKSFEEAAALEKAIELFWSQGYSGASMQDIVTSLGLSRSSLYDTFGDKRQLFIAALAQYQCQSETHLRGLLLSEADVRVGFQRLFGELVEKSLSEEHMKGCLMVNTATEMAAQDEEIAAIVQQNIRQLETLYSEAIARGQAAGQINPSFPADSLARILTNTVLGIRVRVRLGTRRSELEEIVAMTMSLL